MSVKTAAQTSKGYQYQSLYAAKLMIESLINENEYEKFIIEADNNNIAGSAIDDIVCFNNDNKVDYYQVKYTDNLLTHSLSFDWLFDENRRILKKIFDSYKKQIETKDNEMGNIFFITTRDPSTRFKFCLDEQGFLIYEKIDKKNLDIIYTLFGSDLEIFKRFLKVLKFETAENYDLLENNIKKQFYSLSNENDFDKYIRTVERWATNKDTPNKKGIINKNNIKAAIFNKKEYLNQNFNLGQDYVILNDFCKKFEQKIKKNKLIVLYGEAGTGKSSFITNFLKNIKNHIRHYYFLPHQSNNIRRINIDEIKDSLKSQLRRISDEDFDCIDLKEMIEIHDLNSNIENNPFYIVIDGIDHVYRNNKKNIKPLTDFFDLILSINLKNTKIIISTQMTDSNIYPELLLNKLPKEEWIEIDKLTKKEVYKYIKNQNFIINDKLKINDVSNILHEKVKGHPLLLYYIKENFKKTNIINKENLDKIQTCETIREYYDYILSSIDGYEKDILFLMSKYDFIWYNKYLKEIINLNFEKNIINNEKELECNNIKFLFKKTFNNGFTFHHESLSRYIKEINIIEKSEEKNYISTLNDWVKFKSPEYIKNIWGKKLIIENGETFDDINYDWIAKKVSEGYSLVKLKELLSLCIKYSRKKKNTQKCIILIIYFID